MRKQVPEIAPDDGPGRLLDEDLNRIVTTVSRRVFMSNTYTVQRGHLLSAGLPPGDIVEVMAFIRRSRRQLESWD